MKSFNSASQKVGAHVFVKQPKAFSRHRQHQSKSCHLCSYEFVMYLGFTTCKLTEFINSELHEENEIVCFYFSAEDLEYWLHLQHFCSPSAPIWNFLLGWFFKSYILIWKESFFLHNILCNLSGLHGNPESILIKIGLPALHFLFWFHMNGKFKFPLQYHY